MTGASARAEKVVDKVIARVNENVILLSEYSKRAEPIIKEYEKVITAPDKEKKLAELKQNILDQMIDEKLLTQKAKEEKIYITLLKHKMNIDELSEDLNIDTGTLMSKLLLLELNELILREPNNYFCINK